MLCSITVICVDFPLHTKKKFGLPSHKFWHCLCKTFYVVCCFPDGINSLMCRRLFVPYRHFCFQLCTSAHCVTLNADWLISEKGASEHYESRCHNMTLQYSRKRIACKNGRENRFDKDQIKPLVFKGGKWLANVSIYLKCLWTTSMASPLQNSDQYVQLFMT